MQNATDCKLCNNILFPCTSMLVGLLVNLFSAWQANIWSHQCYHVDCCRGCVLKLKTWTATMYRLKRFRCQKGASFSWVILDNKQTSKQSKPPMSFTAVMLHLSKQNKSALTCTGILGRRGQSVLFCFFFHFLLGITETIIFGLLFHFHNSHYFMIYISEEYIRRLMIFLNGHIISIFFRLDNHKQIYLTSRLKLVINVIYFFYFFNVILK